MVFSPPSDGAFRSMHLGKLVQGRQSGKPGLEAEVVALLALQAMLMASKENGPLM